MWEEGEPAKLAARVVNRHYLGDVTHLVVRVEGQENELTLVEANNFGADDLPEGAPVRIDYDDAAFVGMLKQE